MGLVVQLRPLDLRILRECFSGGPSFYASSLGSVGEVAQRLGLHRNTVGPRIRALAQARFFLPWVFDVEAAALGQARARVVFTGPSPWRDPEALAAMLLLEDVKALNEYGDEWGAVVHAASDEALDARVALLQHLGRAKRVHFAYRERAAGATTTRALAARELRVLAGVVGRSGIAFPALAAAVGASERTARRDVERLTRERILTVHYGGTAQPDDAALAYLEVRPRPPDLARLEAAIHGVLMVQVFPDAAHLFLASPTFEAMARQVAAAAAQDPAHAYALRPWTRRHLNARHFEAHAAALWRRAELVVAARRARP
ncbi:MAG: hypothetical protein QOE90_899 [Thermoplasmata archaeon]|nr:hypothetical protein [Thermoplasmata archaeon]